MSQITLRGMGGPLPLTAGGKFQSASPLSSTPGAYGTSVTEDVAQLVGTRWDLNDGREVILVSTSSATTTAAGYLYQDAAIVADHQGLVTTAFVAYGTSGGVANSSSTPATVTVTLGGAAVTANEYQGGYAVVASGTGIGQTLRIASHLAQSSTTGNVTLTLEDAPNVALDTTSTINLIPAHGSNVIISPTAPTNVSAGVALYAIAASTFGFLVSRGSVAVVSDTTAPAVGVSIMPSVTTAGTIAQLSVGGTGTLVEGANLGSTQQAATSAKASTVYLHC